MSYKEINLRANSAEAASTEIMYEIASSRADSVDLIRLNAFYDENAEGDIDYKRMLSSIIRLLKVMKQKGSIQFFATSDSFRQSTTEAVFLQNKYPLLFVNPPSVDNGQFVYIKL